MTLSNQSKLSSIAGLALLFSIPATDNAKAQGPLTELIEQGQFHGVWERAAGDRDPNGPEFVVKFSTMYRGDFTYNENGISGRAIDCDDMVAGRAEDGRLEWKLTGKFLARYLDLADGSAFDQAFDQSKGAVIGPTFIHSYQSHIDQAHHPIAEQDAVSGYCNVRFPPSNDQ